MVDLDDEMNDQEIDDIMEGKQDLVIDLGEQQNLDSLNHNQKIQAAKDKSKNRRKQREMEEKKQKED